jgi:AcrR family transcriptional regulator
MRCVGAYWFYMKSRKGPQSRLNIRPARRSNAARTAESGARMFEAAMTLIGRGGTHNLTLKEIGEEAGYSRSLATARFGSKEGFLNELLINASTRWSELARLKVGRQSGMKALQTFVNTMEQLLRDDIDEILPLYVLCYEVIGSHEAARKTIAGYHQVAHGQLAAWIEEATEAKDADPFLPARDLADLFYFLLYGMIYHWLAAPAAIDPVGEFHKIRLAMDNMLATKAFSTSKSRSRIAR